MGKPWLLLDVDGVLAPFGGEPPTAAQWVRTGCHSIWLPPAIGPRLQTLQQDFRLAWATMWEHQANQVIAPALGLPQLPVIEFRLNLRLDCDTYKLPAVAEFVGNDPFAWIDDDLFPDAFHWAKHRAEPTLLVSTHPSVGVTQEDFDTLEQWVDGLIESGQSDLATLA